MSMRHAALAEIVRRDPRYAYEAYEFVYEALSHTQKLLGRLPPQGTAGEAAAHHVTGRQLLEGIRDLALRQFGLMARIVFRCWGIERTDDFGEIVFNLVEAGLMSKTEEDSRADFHNVFDLDAALTQYQITLEDLE
jgi:uncharacterized repeat protein (TIGR04138 family)